MTEVKIMNFIYIVLFTCSGIILGYNCGKKAKISIKEKELTKILVDNKIKDLENKYNIKIFLDEDILGYNIEMFYRSCKMRKYIFPDINYLYEYIKEDSIEKDIKVFLYDYKN